MELFTVALSSVENFSYIFFVWKILKMHLHKTIFSRCQIRSLDIARMQLLELFTPYPCASLMDKPASSVERLVGSYIFLLAPNFFLLEANWHLGQKCYFEACCGQKLHENVTVD